MFAGTGGEFALEEKVSDGMSLGDLFEDLSEALEWRELGDGTTENLFSGKAEGFALPVVDAEVPELDWVEESEADGGALVDGLELAALPSAFSLALLEGFGKLLAVFYTEGDAEPVKNFSGVVANGL